MRAAHFRALAGAAALLALAGCDSTAGIVLTGASIVSFAATDKFLSDHVVSWARGEDCSTLAAFEDGDYCRPEEAEASAALLGPGRSAAVVEAPLYCYRTLAEITCYDAPDPQASDGIRVQ